MPDTRTRAQRNRAIRQEALREQLEKQKHVEHVIDMVQKIADVDKDLEPDKVSRLKIAIDAKMKLVNKYLPDMKHMEHETGEGVHPLFAFVRDLESKEANGSSDDK